MHYRHFWPGTGTSLVLTISDNKYVDIQMFDIQRGPNFYSECCFWAFFVTRGRSAPSFVWSGKSEEIVQGAATWNFSPDFWYLKYLSDYHTFVLLKILPKATDSTSVQLGKRPPGQSISRFFSEQMNHLLRSRWTIAEDGQKAPRYFRCICFHFV